MAHYRALRNFTLLLDDGREINFPIGELKSIPEEIANHWFFEQNTEPLDENEKKAKAERLERRAQEGRGRFAWPDQPIHSDLADPSTRDPLDTRRTGDFIPADRTVTSVNAPRGDPRAEVGAGALSPAGISPAAPFDFAAQNTGAGQAENARVMAGAPVGAEPVNAGPGINALAMTEAPKAATVESTKAGDGPKGSAPKGK